MLELGGDADLAEEPLAGDGSHDGRAQHLDRDFAAQLAVARQEDRRHAAAPRLALHDVAVAKRVLEPRQQFAHRIPSPSSTPVTCGAALGAQALHQALRRHALLETHAVLQPLGGPALTRHGAHELPALGGLVEDGLDRAARRVRGARGSGARAGGTRAPAS